MELHDSTLYDVNNSYISTFRTAASLVRLLTESYKVLLRQCGLHMHSVRIKRH